MARKIIQIVDSGYENTHIVALMDDGSLWELWREDTFAAEWQWREIPIDIPGVGEPTLNW